MKTRSENYILSSDIPWEAAGEGVRRQIMAYDGQLMLVKVEFQKGAVGSIHAHYHSQASYVVSGKFEVMINGDRKVLKTGDSFYIEPDADHGAICLEAGILIDTFSPMRADFLTKKIN